MTKPRSATSGGSGARLVRAADVREVREEPNGLFLRTLVTGADSAGGLSITRVCVDGTHRRLRAPRTTRTYYVLGGELLFEVGDDPPVLVRKDELLVLPPGVTYGFSGRAAYLVLNTPAFVDGDDEYVDDATPHRT